MGNNTVIKVSMEAEGGYVEVTEDNVTIIDSMKTFFPFSVNEFEWEDLKGIKSELVTNWPDAKIEFLGTF